MNPIRIYDAESESLSLTDVKNHLRISGSDDDDAVRDFIAAIRFKTETYLGQTLVNTTWEYSLDCFPDEILLPMGPVQSITSVSYIDTDGDTQSFSDIQYDSSGRLKPSYDNSWPDTRDQYNAVTITYVAGKTHAGNVQQDIKLAMKLWIGACDINRENHDFSNIVEIPNSAKDVLNMYRNWKL